MSSRSEPRTETAEQTFFLQNLRDAGCPPPMIQQCVALKQQQQIAELLRVLSLQRKALLEALHNKQKQIDCLDYLVYQLEHQPA